MVSKKNNKKYVFLVVLVILISGGYYVFYNNGQNNSSKTSIAHPITNSCNFTLLLSKEIYFNQGVSNHTLCFSLPFGTKGICYEFFSNDTSACIYLGSAGKGTSVACCIPYYANSNKAGNVLVHSTGIWYLSYDDIKGTGYVHFILYYSLTFTGKNPNGLNL
ncbi:MAG: hypothetical protein ACYDAO_10240 [Thermoplasmataceae archaeon]